MVLDYAKDCAYCSTPMVAPPRDGNRSVCAPLHNGVWLEVLKGSAQTVTPQPDGTTETPDSVTFEGNGVTDEPEIEHGVTLGVTSDEDGVTDETKQQRHYRINRERINQERRDRRNGLST